MNAPTVVLPAKSVQSEPVDAEVLASAPAWARGVLTAIEDAARRGAEVTIVEEDTSLTPAQMADSIGISRAGIQRRIAAGDIAYRKIGNRYRISLEEVERFRSTFVRETAATLANDF